MAPSTKPATHVHGHQSRSPSWRAGTARMTTRATTHAASPTSMIRRIGTGTMIGGTTDLTESKLLVAVGTAVIAGVMSILMGLVANFPIALAAGLGINGLITGMVITHASDKITYADLMGLVVIEGVIILVLVLTGFRKAV